jgi:hypothetical protein
VIVGAGLRLSPVRHIDRDKLVSAAGRCYCLKHPEDNRRGVEATSQSSIAFAPFQFRQRIVHRGIHPGSERSARRSQAYIGMYDWSR